MAPRRLRSPAGGPFGLPAPPSPFGRATTQAPSRSAAVDGVHRGIDAAPEHQLDGVCRLLDRDGEGLALLAARGTQHVPGAVAPARWTTDPDAHARETSPSDVRLDGAEPVVAGGPTAELHPHRPDGQVELVVDDDQPAELEDAVAPDERLDRPTRVVHEGLGERKGEDTVVDGRLARERAERSRASKWRAVTTGEKVDGRRTQVVTSPLVLGTGVAEPDGEQVRRAPRARTQQRLALARAVGRRIGRRGVRLGRLLLRRWAVRDEDGQVRVPLGLDARGEREIADSDGVPDL